jgi:exonuclease VII large subunit
MRDPIDVQGLEHDNAETEEDPARDQLEAQLRDSIVGRYIRSYNKRLRTLNQELEEIRQQIDDKLSRVDRRITEEITEARTDVRSLADKLGSEDLGLTLSKIEGLIDAKLDARLDGITARGEADLQKLSTLINDFANEFQAQIDRLANEAKVLRDQARRNQESLRTELTSETETLETTKVDRLTLAETLIMLGMKLREDDLLDEFGINLDFDEDFDGTSENDES